MTRDDGSQAPGGIGRPSDLLGMLVHDLRSPLSAVATHLQLLREEVQGEAAGDVALAQSALETAVARLEETLQIRRLERGGEPLQREAVALAGALSAAVSSVRSAAERRSIRLQTRLEGEPKAFVEPALFRSALQNLLAHSVRHSPGGAEVDVVLEGLGGGVRLEVADRGPGAPSGSAVADDRGARKIGLGLYLVQLVAAGHGGALQIVDREGGGAILRLTLGGA